MRGLSKLVVAPLLVAFALEGALQLGALVARATGRPAPERWLSARRRVLALGDSNTCGPGVEPAQAYPAIFEGLWNTGDGRTPIEVLNLGFAGTNTSKVRRDFPRILRTFRPDIVLLMVGANDYWTVRADEGADESPGSRAERFAWARSRLYRLLLIAYRAVAGGPALQIEAGPMDDRRHGHGMARFGDESFELGWLQRPDFSTPKSVLEQESRADLLAIADEARRADVRLVLLTYPAEVELYRAANEHLRALAHETGLPLVDLGARFRRDCPDDACTAYFFPDHHPNAAGYQRAAELLVEAIAAPEGAEGTGHGPPSASIRARRPATTSE